MISELISQPTVRSDAVENALQLLVRGAAEFLLQLQNLHREWRQEWQLQCLFDVLNVDAVERIFSRLQPFEHLVAAVRILQPRFQFHLFDDLVGLALRDLHRVQDVLHVDPYTVVIHPLIEEPRLLLARSHRGVEGDRSLPHAAFCLHVLNTIRTEDRPVFRMRVPVLEVKRRSREVFLQHAFQLLRRVREHLHRTRVARDVNFLRVDVESRTCTVQTNRQRHVSTERCGIVPLDERNRDAQLKVQDVFFEVEVPRTLQNCWINQPRV